MRKKHKAACSTADQLLGPFIDFADHGEDELARYMLHCGIDHEDIAHAGTARDAILLHYRCRDGTYDIARAAADLARWPPIAARIKELTRDQRRQAARGSANGVRSTPQRERVRK